MSSRWRVRLSAAAADDFSEILFWTAERFGPQQSELYEETLVLAFGALESGPDALGCRPVDKADAGFWALHVARNGRRGRHILVYRAQPGDVIEIVRILHDSMDLYRHLPSIGE